MRTIEETIAYYEQKAKENRAIAKDCEECANRKIDQIMKLDKVHNRDKEQCNSKAEEYEQIVIWLKELIDLKKKT